MKRVILLFLVFLSDIGSSYGHETLSPKIWFSRKINDEYLVSGRPTLREIKYAAELGIKTIISIFPYNETVGSDPEQYLPTTAQAKVLAASIGIAHHTILDPGDTKWQSVAAVARFRDIVKYATRPVLVHCDVSFVSTFITLSHFFNVTYHNDITHGELAVSGEEAFKMASRYGFDFTSTNLTDIFRELSGNWSAEYGMTPPPSVSFPTWFLGYWQARPVYGNWFISGQIQKHHFPTINASWSKLEPTNSAAKRISIVNLRQGINSQPRPEEVTLLNVKDGTGSDRQDIQNLESSRIDVNKANNYISDTATRNFETRNSLEFGDELGYNETMEREFIQHEYGDFMNYIHIPISIDGRLTANEYQTFREHLVEADRSTLVIVHSASVYRAGLVTFLAAGDLKNRSIDWIKETSMKYLNVGIMEHDLSMIRDILDPSSVSPGKDDDSVDRCSCVCSSVTLAFFSIIVATLGHVMW